METMQFPETESAPRNWQELAGEAIYDHLTANSICILACHEFEQNGASE
jgi:hypothetical protein